MRPFKPMLFILITSLFALIAAGPLHGEDKDDNLLVVRAAKIYRGDGTVLDNGVLVIKDGKIIQTGSGAIDVPESAWSISSEAGIVTPGLIDASSLAGLINKNSWTEHSSEIVPHLSVLDAVDLGSRDFERLVRQGVTTVFVTPGSGSVIGCRGCVLKTAGPLDKRVVVEKGAVKATMGRDSYSRGAYNRRPYGREVSFMTRRPTTRMGVTAVFQDALYAAAAFAAERSKKGPKATAPDQATAVLADVLDGKIPFRVQARKDNDIVSAIRLCNEFGLDFVLEEAIEAHRCLPELKARGVPIVFGPVYAYPVGYRSRTREADRSCLNTVGLLQEAGLRVALTASDQSGEGALPHQATFAMRGGLSRAGAIDATTAAPAEILGLEERIGKLEAGFDADLVVWNGEPFAPTSHPIIVVVDGKPVYVYGVTQNEMNELGAEEPGEK